MARRTRPDLGTQQYKRARAALNETSSVCALCGGPIDFDAPPKTRWAPSADHIDPVSLGGSVDWLQLAHYGCNSAKGNRVARPSSRASRAW